MVLLQEGGPPPGPETGLLSNTRKWIAWGDTCAHKARDFIGKRRLGGEQEGKGTQENFLPHDLQSWFYGDGNSFRLSLANHSDSESFPGGPRLVQPAKMDAREKDSGRWSDRWCLLLTFPELFWLWRLISALFLTRTSCGKTTHANGYYGAWPGWAVLISVVPLTVLDKLISFLNFHLLSCRITDNHMTHLYRIFVRNAQDRVSESAVHSTWSKHIWFPVKMLN